MPLIWVIYLTRGLNWLRQSSLNLKHWVLLSHPSHALHCQSCHDQGHKGRCQKQAWVPCLFHLKHAEAYTPPPPCTLPPVSCCLHATSHSFTRKFWAKIICSSIQLCQSFVVITDGSLGNFFLFSLCLARIWGFHRIWPTPGENFLLKAFLCL